MKVEIIKPFYHNWATNGGERKTIHINQTKRGIILMIEKMFRNNQLPLANETDYLLINGEEYDPFRNHHYPNCDNEILINF